MIDAYSGTRTCEQRERVVVAIRVFGLRMVFFSLVSMTTTTFIQNVCLYCTQHIKKRYSFVSSNLKVVKKDQYILRFKGKLLVTMKAILWGNCVGNQVFSETHKVRSVGGYSELLKSAQDFDLWIRLIERWGSGYRVGAALYYVDQNHGMSRISTSEDKMEGATEFYRIHRERFSVAQRTLYNLEFGRIKYSDVPLIRRLYTLCHIGASLCFPSGWLYRLNVRRSVW